MSAHQGNPTPHEVAAARLARTRGWLTAGDLETWQLAHQRGEPVPALLAYVLARIPPPHRHEVQVVGLGRPPLGQTPPHPGQAEDVVPTLVPPTGQPFPGAPAGNVTVDSPLHAAPWTPAAGAAATSELKRVAALAYEAAAKKDPYFSPHVKAALKRVGDKPLGRGGMGEVWRVRDERLGREAALKLVLSERADEGALLRFRREVEITARLDHPSIPPVYEAGTDAEGRHYMLMRVIEGRPLSKALREHHDKGGGAAAPSRELLEVLVKVGEAVAYAHSRGVMHRDLKPDNVMVGRFGEVMVMDWGLARRQDAPKDDDAALAGKALDLSGEEAKAAGFTQTGAVMGTPCYMAPEQASGDGVVDARADVFALGAVLVEILTGRPPIEGQTIVQQLYATLYGRVARPRERRPDLPAPLDSIADHALARDPEARTPSAEAFVGHLRAWLSDAPVATYHYSLFEKALRFARHHPTWLVAAAGLALLATTAAGLLAAKNRAVAAEVVEKERARSDAEDARNVAVREAARAKQEEMRAKLEAALAQLHEAFGHAEADRAADAAQAFARALQSATGVEHAEDLRACAARGARDAVAHTGLERTIPAVAVVAASRDGRWVAFIAPGRLEVRDATALDGPPAYVVPFEGTFVGCGLARDGSRGALVTQSSKLYVFTRDRVERVLDVAEPSCVAIAPDGKSLAVGTRDGLVRFGPCEGPLGVELRHVADDRQGEVHACAFSGDGRRLVSAGERAALVWDVATRQRRVLVDSGAPPIDSTRPGTHDGTIFACATSADGAWIATAASELKLWRASSGELVHTLPLAEAGGAHVSGVTFDASGERVTATTWAGVTRVWSTEEGRLLRTLHDPEADRLGGVHWAGSFVLTSSAWHGTTRVWSPLAEVPSQISTSAIPARLSCVAFAGREVMAGSDAQHAPAVHRVSLDDLRVSGSLAAAAPVQDVVALPGGEVAVGIGGRVEVRARVDAPRPRLVFQATDDHVVRACVVAQAGHIIVCSEYVQPGGVPADVQKAYGGVARWDLATGQREWEVRLPGGVARACAASPDGRRVAVAAVDGVAILETERGEIPTDAPRSLATEGAPLALAWSAQALVAGTDTGRVHMWSTAADGSRETLAGHSTAVEACGFAPDGTLWTGSLDGTLRHWDLFARAPLRVLRAGGPIRCLAVSSDGRTLAAAGGGEGVLHVWRLTPATLQGLEATPVGTVSAALGLGTVR